MPTPTLDLSVVICTRNRPASLKVTLGGLIAADRQGIQVEVVIIDNGTGDETKAVAEAAMTGIDLRYFREPREGKGHSLNRALSAGGLGRIIAGLDDDMSPEPDWMQEVIASCDRHPDVDIFGGLVYIIWPAGPVPKWALQCRGDVMAWGFSALGERNAPQVDYPVRPDRGPCGNHFWFRADRLTSASRFGHLWVPEPALFLDMKENGSKAIITNRVVAGHRIQPELLVPATHYRRAKMMGHNFATDALRPYRASLKVPQSFHRRPLLTRMYCLLMIARFCAIYVLASLGVTERFGVVKKIGAIERISFFIVLLQIASQDEPYRIWRR